MKLFVLITTIFLFLIPSDSVAYDKSTKSCMYVCMMRNDPHQCKGERSVPRCRSCVRDKTARIKACFKSECGLDDAEAAYESELDPKQVCG